MRPYKDKTLRSINLLFFLVSFLHSLCEPREENQAGLALISIHQDASETQQELANAMGIIRRSVMGIIRRSAAERLQNLRKQDMLSETGLILIEDGARHADQLSEVDEVL